MRPAHLKAIVYSVLALVSLLQLTGQSSDAHSAEPDQSERPRLLVLTDIGGDPDDHQSMIRLLVHANEFDIEGLVASASGTPGELGEAITQPQLIHELVDAYEKVHDNLEKHDAAFPSVAFLRDVIKSGNPNRHWMAVGADQDTEGSNWILECARREDSRPLNIVIWGGQTDLAQGLWRAREDGDLEQVANAIRVYDIADQDGIAEQIWSEFPGLFYVLSKAPEGADRREALFRGMYLRGDEGLTSREWIAEHVKDGHGPLGAMYPMKTWTAPNPHGVLKEGDTPSWFYFLPVGLGVPETPGVLGWGGLFHRASNETFRDAFPRPDDQYDVRETVARWRPAFQNEFAARMDWCVSDPDQANHPPQPVLNGEIGLSMIRVTAQPGQKLRFSADGSTDPDSDSLGYRWWIDELSSSSRDSLNIDGEKEPACQVTVPESMKPGEYHVVLEITDTGSPPLTRYRRATIDVQ